MIPRMKDQQWEPFVFWRTKVIKRVGGNMRSITQLCDMLLNYLAQPMLSQKSHYNDYIMSVVASQITSLTIVYSTAYSGADQRKHQSSASLANVSIWRHHHARGTRMRTSNGSLFRAHLLTVCTICSYQGTGIHASLIQWCHICVFIYHRISHTYTSYCQDMSTRKQLMFAVNDL